ncbi:cation diffusion facilitator family transporter [Planctomycetes bacterium K23_9]|uniref:Cadmium, cobalt and zinc/H(+)-K(+) antiporter n=1 Tax=Stieleria marina TaxID=1930275 RepID=A0A517NPM5_9BACT|nr:Cadmium, cobalt and zinc/H(+)-K(+) antiporter [Planctomycetes bacterium K23_9]
MHQCAQHPAPASYGRAFAIGILLNVVFVVVEAGFGFATNSLALLADAGHNLSDVLGLLMAWGGYALAKVAPSPKRTYGWRGSTILAALFNALLLMVAIGGITWEAIGRFSDPAEVTAPVIIGVALIGVVINTATALLFVKGRKGDLNIRGAYLHMAADALLSLGVVVAGIVIAMTSWQWVDPLTSLLIAAVILFGTWGLFKESINLAVAGVPDKIDPADVQDFLTSIPGVTAVHDLHIWAMSTTEIALTAHLVKPDADDEDSLLKETASELHHLFDISHTTIQIERCVDATNCGQAADGTL